MNELKLTQVCLKDALHDEVAVRVLRRVVCDAAKRAPADSLVEIVEAMINIRQRERLRKLESN
jgi:hypothetical protein